MCSPAGLFLSQADRQRGCTLALEIIDTVSPIQSAVNLRQLGRESAHTLSSRKPRRHADIALFVAISLTVPAVGWRQLAQIRQVLTSPGGPEAGIPGRPRTAEVGGRTGPSHRCGNSGYVIQLTACSVEPRDAPLRSRHGAASKGANPMGSLHLRTPDLHDFSDVVVARRGLRPLMLVVAAALLLVIGRFALQPADVAANESAEVRIISMPG
jgi:hypothetical protein